MTNGDSTSATNGMTLRPYQVQALDSVRAAMARKAKTVCIMATGTGKTVLFANLAKQFIGFGRALIVAHRRELVWQAKRVILKATGIDPSIEMAELSERFSPLLTKSPIVITTVESMSGSRILHFPPNEFSLVVIDECHHSLAPTYKRIIDKFVTIGGSAFCGFTATLDRGDKHGFRGIFDEIAYKFPLAQAMAEHWLVPIVFETGACEGMDLRGVPTHCGDLEKKALREVMERNPVELQIASETCKRLPDQRALIFATSVRGAHSICGMINEDEPGSSRVIWSTKDQYAGLQDEQNRAAVLADYRNNRFKRLVNMGIATEGFDVPGIQAIVLARPTKSRMLMEQMIGRGTRPDVHLPHDSTPESRAELIRNSSKPHLLVLDFVGNAGKHKLVSVPELFMAKTAPEKMAMYKKKAHWEGARMLFDGESVKVSDPARDSGSGYAWVPIETRFKWQVVNPFQIGKFRRIADDGNQCAESIGVRASRCGILDKDLRGKELAEIEKLVEHWEDRMRTGLATYKQVRVLERLGLNATNMSKEHASRLIGLAEKNGWRLPTKTKREDARIAI